MASKIDKQAYGSMISALNTFASNVYTASSELQTLASVCVQAIGEEDMAVVPIYDKIKDCQLKYAEAAEEARSIAASMQEELEEALKEEQIWAGDEE